MPKAPHLTLFVSLLVIRLAIVSRYGTIALQQPAHLGKLKEIESIDRARSLTNKVIETRDSCESLASQRNVAEHGSHEERI